jgi:hypothetical protein
VGEWLDLGVYIVFEVVFRMKNISSNPIFIGFSSERNQKLAEMLDILGTIF